MFLRIAILIVTVAGILGGAAMLRKDFSSDIEVVNRKGIITVIHNNTLSTRDLVVEILGRRDATNIDLPAKQKFIDIPVTDPAKPLQLKISRKDLLGRIRYKPVAISVPAIEKPYVVLVGASIGNAWDLVKLPVRRGIDNIVLGFRYKNVFDKTDVLQSLAGMRNKPNIVIIKECAAYFPRDTKKSLHEIEGWVEFLRRNDIIPALATCVPVTPINDRKNAGRQESINQFNEAIRLYAADKSLPLLDLQKILGDGKPGGYLREEYSDSDGLHLKQRTYREAVDSAMVSFLATAIKRQSVPKQIWGE